MAAAGGRGSVGRWNAVAFPNSIREISRVTSECNWIKLNAVGPLWTLGLGGGGRVV